MMVATMTAPIKTLPTADTEHVRLLRELAKPGMYLAYSGNYLVLRSNRQANYRRLVPTSIVSRLLEWGYLTVDGADDRALFWISDKGRMRDE